MTKYTSDELLFSLCSTQIYLLLASRAPTPKYNPQICIQSTITHFRSKNSTQLCKHSLYGYFINLHIQSLSLRRTTKEYIS